MIRYGLALNLVWMDALSVGALRMFLTAVSFVRTTPGVAARPGFPFLSRAGQFMVENLMPVGASIWTAGESLDAASATKPAR